MAIVGPLVVAVGCCDVAAVFAVTTFVSSQLRAPRFAVVCPSRAPRAPLTTHMEHNTTSGSVSQQCPLMPMGQRFAVGCCFVVQYGHTINQWACVALELELHCTAFLANNNNVNNNSHLLSTIAGPTTDQSLCP